MCVTWGVGGGWGSHKAFLFVLALPGWTHPLGKLGARGALETPPGRSARPGGRRQETEKMSGEPEEARWAWLRGRAREEGLRLPTLGRGGAGRGAGGAVGARICGEHWRGGSESLVGSPGPRWGWGHCWRIQIPFSLSFVLWWGRQVHSPAWEHLMSCGWSPACPPFLGHQVDWTDRPGSCFSPLRRRGQVEAWSREA